MIEICFITGEDKSETYWKEVSRYMKEDVVPDCDPTLTDEELEWFESDNYKDHVNKLLVREADPLDFVYFKDSGIILGFSAFVIYKTEDGKCFILDFCIFDKFRNKGLGSACYNELEKILTNQGANYFSLTCSNNNNLRFWSKNGFYEDSQNESGQMIYTKRLG